MYGQVKIQIFI